MANFVYDHARYLLATGALNLATADMRILLVMTNSTADTEKEKATIGAFTALDEYDGSGYSSGGVALASEAVSEDNTNHRAEFTSAAAAFGALAVATRQGLGAVLYAFVSSLSASIPVAWIDTVTGSPTFPFTGNGSNVTLTPNAEGWVQI